MQRAVSGLLKPLAIYTKTAYLGEAGYFLNYMYAVAYRLIGEFH